MPKTTLTEYELKVLRAFAHGTVDDMIPGAALNSAAEFLSESGYLNLKNGCPTTEGKRILGIVGPGTTVPRIPHPYPQTDIGHSEGENSMRTDYQFGFAKHATRKSKDSTKVGAALVGPDGEIRLTAFNGPPKGVEDRPERFLRPAKYLYASHAEANLVAFAAREGIRTKGCTVYVTHHPCASCARSLIQAGISGVVYAQGTTSMPQAEFDAAGEMFTEAGVEVAAIQS